jgi:hypothetical protein
VEMETTMGRGCASRRRTKARQVPGFRVAIIILHMALVWSSNIHHNLIVCKLILKYLHISPKIRSFPKSTAIKNFAGPPQVLHVVAAGPKASMSFDLCVLCLVNPSPNLFHA